MPAARITDRATSHAAARAALVGLRDSQQAVLAVMRRERVGMTDDQLVVAYDFWRSKLHLPPQSVSGIRTRRAELERLGLVLDVGTTRNQHGRRCTLWAAASLDAQQELGL